MNPQTIKNQPLKTTVLESKPVILFENDHYTFIMDGEILWHRYKKDVIIDASVSSSAIKKRLELSQESKYLICDAFEVKYWTMSSRNNDMMDRAYEKITKAAVILPKSSISVLWFLAIILSPPPIPTKTFKKHQDAKAWLLNEIKKDQLALKKANCSKQKDL